jgi:hypothetical protein
MCKKPVQLYSTQIQIKRYRTTKTYALINNNCTKKTITRYVATTILLWQTITVLIPFKKKIYITCTFYYPCPHPLNIQCIYISPFYPCSYNKTLLLRLRKDLVIYKRKQAKYFLIICHLTTAMKNTTAHSYLKQSYSPVSDLSFARHN